MDTAFLYLILWAAILGVIFAILIKKRWILGGVKMKTGVRRSLDLTLVSSKWQEIQQLVGQGKPSTYKVAVMEADQLLDYVLKAKIGTEGTMKDRLIKSRNLFSGHETYKNVGYAHGYRNRVVHDADHELFAAEVKKVIASFEKALKELKAL